MNIIIVGCGSVGRTLAQKLNDDGNAVTVIDMSSEKIQKLTNRCDVMGIVGNGATYTVQREAGINTADLFIAVTGSDELNLLCCMIAKKEGNCQTIARVKSPEYSQETAYFKEELGLAMVINPEYAAAEEIARLLRFPSATKIETFAKGKVELVTFKLDKESVLVGLSVKDVMLKYRSDVLITTVERGDETYIPNGDFVFAEKDVVTISGSVRSAYDFFGKIGKKGANIKKTLVVGGGVITHYLCDILSRSGISLTVIAKDMAVCEELCAKWDKITVIHGDATDYELLQEEGVATADAFVAVTDGDEENILLSLYAKDAGGGKLITKINRVDYGNVVEKLELDAIICPRNLTAAYILRYVRAMQNTRGSDMLTLYSVNDTEVEAAEFIVKKDSPIIGKPLSELQLEKDVLIASIIRGKNIITPRGHDVIQEGDDVVVVCKYPIYDIAEVLK